MSESDEQPPANDWTCPGCGLRFRLDTLTGPQRAEPHRRGECRAPTPAAHPIPHKPGVKFTPGVVKKRYPYRRRGTGGKGY